MIFQEFKYERPDMDKLGKEVDGLIKKLENSKSVEEQNQLIGEYNKLFSYLMTQFTLCSIRHSINTNDEFYMKENDFMDANEPVATGWATKFNKAILNSPFRAELEAKWGKQIFVLAELQMKTFKDEVLKDLQEENRLVSEYRKLEASAKIVFQGEERNTSEMEPFKLSDNRETRKAAWEAYAAFFSENEDKFDAIYDSMVKVRHNIAKKLGYNNFVELAYDRHERSDYDAKMVANYRKQVRESLVPYVQELKERQRQRLGYDKLYYYDESLTFLTGNPTPKGEPEWIVEQGKKMYEELSPETGKFINMMIDQELLDLLSKKGKMNGGYCTELPDYGVPFIFANFNGTSGDVDVLTHEAGHAFQGYMSQHFDLLAYHWPTKEACEIHSMGMEYMTWPWMDKFFIEDTEKYKFMHLAEGVSFIPYGVTVDEFQHWVYEHPEATPAERKAAWKEIEGVYMPWRDFEDNSFYQSGGFWSNKLHIFCYPFYYIDYTIAQICALQFWKRSRENRQEAWADYVELCKTGGSQSFLNLLKVAKLDNPFEDGCINKVMVPIKEYLNSVDDTKL